MRNAATATCQSEIKLSGTLLLSKRAGLQRRFYDVSVSPALLDRGKTSTQVLHETLQIATGSAGAIKDVVRADAVGEFVQRDAIVWMKWPI